MPLDGPGQGPRKPLGDSRGYSSLCSVVPALQTLGGGGGGAETSVMHGAHSLLHLLTRILTRVPAPPASVDPQLLCAELWEHGDESGSLVVQPTGVG